MALILDGKSEMGKDVKSNLSYLLWSNHLIIAVTNPFFFLKKTYLFTFMRAQHVLSDHLVQVPCNQATLPG